MPTLAGFGVVLFVDGQGYLHNSVCIQVSPIVRVHDRELRLQQRRQGCQLEAKNLEVFLDDLFVKIDDCELHLFRQDDRDVLFDAGRQQVRQPLLQLQLLLLLLVARVFEEVIHQLLNVLVLLGQ